MSPSYILCTSVHIPNSSSSNSDVKNTPKFHKYQERYIAAVLELIADEQSEQQMKSDYSKWTKFNFEREDEKCVVFDSVFYIYQWFLRQKKNKFKEVGLAHRRMDAIRNDYD